MNIRLASVAALLSLLAFPVMAQEPAPGGKEWGRLAACREDIRTYCQSAEAGRGRRVACLLENKAKLSPGCTSALEARLANAGKGRAGSAPVQAGPPPTAAAPEVAEAGPGKKGRGGRLAACRTDLATHCQAVEKGAGGRLACLRQNEAKLAPDCKAAIGEIASRTRQMRDACRSDAETLCSGVQRGKGAVAQCLQANREKLTAACSEALAAAPARGKGRRAAVPSPETSTATR